MKTTTKILLGVGAAAVVGGIAYHNAAKQVQFGLFGMQVTPTGIQVQIRAYNPSRIFGYPVPMVDLGVFDTNDTFLGTVHTSVWQFVPPGISYIEATLQPNIATVGNAIASLITGKPLTDFILQGYVRLGRFNIPVGGQVSVAGFKETFAVATALTPWPIL